MKAIQKGFSLIELMIVIAIIGILAAIAIPSYQSYVLKSRLGELITAASAATEAAIEYVQSSGAADCTNMPIVQNGPEYTGPLAGSVWGAAPSGPFPYPTDAVVSGVYINSNCDVFSAGQPGIWGPEEGTLGYPIIFMRGNIAANIEEGQSYICQTWSSNRQLLPYAPSTCVASTS